MTLPHDDDPLSLQDSIDGVVRSMQGGGRRPSGQAQAMGGVFGRWSEIVGENVAAHVQPVRLDGARLVVEVTDPAWATQIRRLSDTLRTAGPRRGRHDDRDGRGTRRRWPPETAMKHC